MDLHLTGNPFSGYTTVSRNYNSVLTLLTGGIKDGRRVLDLQRLDDVPTRFANMH